MINANNIKKLVFAIITISFKMKNQKILNYHYSGQIVKMSLFFQ